MQQPSQPAHLLEPVPQPAHVGPNSNNSYVKKFPENEVKLLLNSELVTSGVGSGWTQKMVLHAILCSRIDTFVRSKEIILSLPVIGWTRLEGSLWHLRSDHFPNRLLHCLYL
jgi:hypothetical protein